MSHSRAGTTTRSPEPMSVKTDVDNNNYYYMVPGQQKLPVLQQQAPSPFYPSPLSAVSSQQQQFHSPTMSQIWASPRSSVDEFDNYSYSHQGPAPTSYHAASMSPRTWSSSVQTPPSQFETPFHHQEEEYDGLAGGEPMVSPEGLTHQHPEPFMGYGVPCYQSAASASSSQCAPHAGSSSQDSVTMRYDSPPVVVETVSGAPVFTGSPAPMEQHQDECGELKTSPSPPARGVVVEPAPPVEQQQQQQPPPEGSRDNGDPYAQLIWKALKARDNRAMTLQQLYQWFLDNTDKPAKAGNGGWRNSIRHNLSMNEAFCKREQTITDAYRSTAAPTTNERKPTEWFLRPEFEDRVMPTTHYRDVPRNSGRRNKTAAGAAAGRNRRVYHSSPDFPSRSVPARALSGRRGGRATTRSRNAARNLRLRPDESSMQWNAGFAAQQHNLEAFRQLPYTTQSDFDRISHMQRNQAASARFRARAEAVRREQQQEALRQQELQQQQHAVQTTSPGIVPHHAQQYFPGYPMDVAGVYEHQQQHAEVQPQPHQIQGHADNSSVFYGWGGSTNHGL
ncbi:forkhead domain-containing protein [Colletotrichum plurivorum]|uniref:Forkhead box protein O n=1 Tax=Colletotrichum plurivorum TaxID=2175906 RepID=A0A8H6KMW3_9PEZI|nr:forkhead domain-containing protein [Colletotrichum plurivorum]